MTEESDFTLKDHRGAEMKGKSRIERRKSKVKVNKDPKEDERNQKRRRMRKACDQSKTSGRGVTEYKPAAA